MSKIEWTDETWNPVVGCTPVSPGCLNCYAAEMARRLEAMGRPEYAPRRRDTDGRDVTGLPGLQDEADRILRIAEVKNGRAVFTGEVRTLEDRLIEPLGWKKPRRVFVNSMSDLFHDSVPFEFIDRVFAVMALCPQHTFQVLTKRPERMATYLSWRGRGGCTFYEPPVDRALLTDAQLDRLAKAFNWPLPNIWLGTSVEDQARADERIPWLLKCPAKVRFLSCEPLLGEVDLLIPVGCRRCNHPGNVFPRENCPRCGGSGQEPSIDWVIVGGESGAASKIRACDVGWIRSIVGQCRDAGVPVFVKQLGAKVQCRNDHVSDWMDQPGGPSLMDINTEVVQMQGDPVRVYLADRKGGDMAEWPEDLRVREFPTQEDGLQCGGSAPTPQGKAETGRH